MMLTSFGKGTQSNAEDICPSSNCFLCVIALLTTVHGSGFVCAIGWGMATEGLRVILTVLLTNFLA